MVASGTTMSLKELKKETKRLRAEEKRKRKDRKKEHKRKKEEMRLTQQQRRMGVKSGKLPGKGKVKPGEKLDRTTPAIKIGPDVPEAEIISEADVWTPKSAKKIDEIQKRIDRMDKDGVKSLRERYNEKYGEDLKVPDIYDTSPSIEVETALEAGELEAATPDKMLAKGKTAETNTDSKPKKSLFGRSKKAPKPEKMVKPKVKRQQRLFDLRTPFYFKNTRGKTVLIIVDLILFIPLFIPRIFGMIIYIRKDRREAEYDESYDDSYQVQPY